MTKQEKGLQINAITRVPLTKKKDLVNNQEKEYKEKIKKQVLKEQDILYIQLVKGKNYKVIFIKPLDRLWIMAQQRAMLGKYTTCIR